MRTADVPTLSGRPGTALIEALLSLCFMAMLCLAGIEVFAAGRGVFFRLNTLQEREERAATGLDRIRLDVREAGRGLVEPAALGLVTGLTAQEGRVLLLSLEKAAPLGGDAAAGTSFVPLSSASGFTAGRSICVLAPGRGEIGTVASIREDGVVLSAPLAAGYPAGSASLLLLRTVEIFWDRDARVVRRRVNDGSAQPLVESASGFYCRLDAATWVLGLELHLDGNEEIPYAASVLPKNILLSGAIKE
jgi:hypothetical protein